MKDILKTMAYGIIPAAIFFAVFGGLVWLFIFHAQITFYIIGAVLVLFLTFAFGAIARFGL